jgi:hypothetical protein
VDTASLEQQQHSWEGMVIAKQPGTLNMREAMYYSLPFRSAL